MKNIEIKVKLESLEEVENILNIFPEAKYSGVLNQIDTYYICNGSKRLKLREINTKENVIIYYDRANKAESKFSKYYIINIPNRFLKVTKILLNYFFGIKVVINKKRDLWIFRNTRIHLDKVINLGNFLELETVVRDSDLVSQEEYSNVFERLNLQRYKRFSHSYSDYAIVNNII